MVNKILYFIVYTIGLVISFLIFGKTTMNLDSIGVLSQGAILATFGAALMTLSDIFERDKLERVKMNVNILYRDIYKEPSWRRWPFLQRQSSHKLFTNQAIISELKNPTKEFDVGTHNITVHIITVLEDFFDLPVFGDWFKMQRFKRAFMTKLHRDTEEIGATDKEEKMHSYMAFLCLHDSLVAACIFRLARILKHFSIALVFGSVLMSGLCIKYPNIIGCINFKTISTTSEHAEVININATKFYVNKD